jgi:hypothetical protein
MKEQLTAVFNRFLRAISGSLRNCLEPMPKAQALRRRDPIFVKQSSWFWKRTAHSLRKICATSL